MAVTTVAATFIADNQFSVVGDQTANFEVDRRTYMVDSTTKYGTIVTSSFGGGITTITLSSGSDNITSSLTAAAHSIISIGTDSAQVEHGHTTTEGDGGALTGYTSTSQMTTISGDIVAQIGSSDHGGLSGLTDDDHVMYSRVDGIRAFTNTVSGVTPTLDPHLTTKAYVDSEITTATGALNTDHNAFTGLQGGTTDEYYHLTAFEESQISAASAEIITIGGVADTRISVDAGNNKVEVTADAVEMTIDATGMKLKNSTIFVNDIPNVTDGDSISTASTDAQLATAKLIYNHVDTVSGTMDHGGLLGRGDDDHPQYVNNSEMTTISGDITSQIVTDHGALTGLSDNDHTQYVTGVSGSTPLRGGGQTLGFDETVVDHDNLTNTHNLTTDIDHDALTNFETNEHFTEGSIDHGSIGGLIDDDHTQYLLADGSRHAASLIIDGDLIVSGTRFIANTETVLIEDNLLVINYGEPGAGVTEGEAGIEVDRGSEVNYRFMFDETNDHFEVGVSGSEQAVATRQDSPTASGISYWNNDATRFDTAAGFIFTGGQIRIPAAVPSNIADATRKDYVDSEITTATGALTGNDITMERIAGSTFSTAQHMQDIFHSSGWSSGGTITSGTTTTVDVATGTGFIRDASSSIATVFYFDWSASSALSVPTNTTRYIGVEYNSGSPQVVVRSSYNWDFTTDFPLGSVVNENNTLHILNATHAIGDHANNMIQRSYQTMPLKRDDRAGGLILGEDGTRNITLTTGALWERLERFTISAISTSGTDTFDRYYQDGSGGWTKEPAQTQWNNTQYDDGDGGLQTIANNRYSTQYFYIELDGDMVSLYGQAQYTSLANAQDDSPPSTVPDRLNVHGKLIGRIVFQESAASAALVESVFDTSFSTTLVTDHGNLAGLSDDDHTLYSLADGTRAFTGTVGGVTPSADADLATKGYVDGQDSTISGDLSNEIDSDITTHEAGSSHDGRYYTETEVDTWRNSTTQTEMGYVNGVSSDIQTQIDTKLSTAQFTVSSGDLQNNIDALTHDGFADFVTNEHLDWTADLGADNMHDNNIVASNVTQHEASIDHDALNNFATDEHFTEASIDHGSIGGLTDDDHPQYINNDEMTTISGDIVSQITGISNVVEDTTPQLGGDLDTNGNDILFGTDTISGTGVMVTGDHATSSGSFQVSNVVYGTGDPPTAVTTPIGTIFIKYTA